MADDNIESEMDTIKLSDWISTLKRYMKFTDTGVWEPGFSYPNCPQDLFRCGLLSQDGNITLAGRAALWMVKEGPDPTSDSKSFISYQFPAPKKDQDAAPKAE